MKAVKSASASPIDLQIIVGKRPWRVWKGVGSFLLFEFGRVYRCEDGNCRGAYTLWIYMADWRIQDSRRMLAHSESPDRSIHRAAEVITNKRLEGVVLSTVVLKRNVRYGVIFHFEGGYDLRATMYDGNIDDEIFMLYSPQGYLSYNSDGTISSSVVDTRRTKHLGLC